MIKIYFDNKGYFSFGAPAGDHLSISFYLFSMAIYLFRMAVILILAMIYPNINHKVTFFVGEWIVTDFIICAKII